MLMVYIHHSSVLFICMDWLCVYDSGDQWQQAYQAHDPTPLPILQFSDSKQHVDGSPSTQVESVQRYKHCQRTLHCKPEPSILRTLPHCNLNQICRDDLMHLCLAGMMQHVLGAMMTYVLMWVYMICSIFSGPHVCVLPWDLDRHAVYDGGH